MFEANDHANLSLRAVASNAYKEAEILAALEFHDPAAEFYEIAVAADLAARLPGPLCVLRWLDIDRHFERNACGQPCRVELDAHMLNDRLVISQGLSTPAPERMHRFLTVFRPTLLNGQSSSLLFPERTDRGGLRTVYERLTFYLLTRPPTQPIDWID